LLAYLFSLFLHILHSPSATLDGEEEEEGDQTDTVRITKLTSTNQEEEPKKKKKKKKNSSSVIQDSSDQQTQRKGGSLIVLNNDTDLSSDKSRTQSLGSRSQEEPPAQQKKQPPPPPPRQKQQPPPPPPRQKKQEQQSDQSQARARGGTLFSVAGGTQAPEVSEASKKLWMRLEEEMKRSLNAKKVLLAASDTSSPGTLTPLSL